MWHGKERSCAYSLGKHARMLRQSVRVIGPKGRTRMVRGRNDVEERRTWRHHQAKLMTRTSLLFVVCGCA